MDHYRLCRAQSRGGQPVECRWSVWGRSVHTPALPFGRSLRRPGRLAVAAYHGGPQALRTRRSARPKYLFIGKYTAEGARGVLKDGGSKRRQVARNVMESLGGSVEAYYFGFGDDDFYVIADLPRSGCSGCGQPHRWCVGHNRRADGGAADSRRDRRRRAAQRQLLTPQGRKVSHFCRRLPPGHRVGRRT
jgi:hypothetical protein